MSTYGIRLTRRLHDYLIRTSVREDAVLERLRRRTRRMRSGAMQVSPEQGQLMALLVELMGARKAIEIGTFTGYSAIWVARALGPGGRLVCCDINEDWTRIARAFWREAGVEDRIDLRLAPAADTLAALLAEGAAGSFDFAFIDADKVNYDLYYERCLELVRPGGLIAIDNVLWGGRVADGRRRDPDTRAIRALNEKLREDRRIRLSLVPIGDGLTLALKRA